MKNRTTIYDRVLALVLCAVMVLGMMPTGVAADDGVTTTKGTITALTGEIEVVDTSVTVKNAALEYVSTGNEQGRTPGWWAGVLVTAPDTLVADAASITYGSKSFAFKDCKDSENTVGLWLPVTPDDVKNHSTVDRQYDIDWDGDNVMDQTIHVFVDTSTVTLLKGGKNIFYGEVSGISGTASVSGSATNNTEITVSGAELDWVDANDSGRTAGWWAGILVEAPAEYAENASLSYDYNGETRSFAFSDVQRGDGTVGLWVPVDTTDAERGDVVSRIYAFDWNGDGEPEQTVVFNVNAGTLTLKKNGMVVYPAYATVEGITGEVYVSNSGAKSMSATVTAAQLDWVAADASIGRNQDGWWAGVLVTPPVVVNEETASIQYPYGGETKVFSYASCKRADGTVGLWLPITQYALSTATNPTRTYSFDWNGDGNCEQTLTVTVELSDNIILTKNGAQVYPAYGTVTPLTPSDAEISGNGTANVTATAENAVLQWHAADPFLGREKDGWWVGVQVNAPETGFNSKIAGFAVKDGDSYDDDKSFDTYKDGDDYIQLWVYVDAEALNQGDVTKSCGFDWNGVGGYEQIVDVTVKADGTVLLKDGKQVHPGLTGTVTTTVGTVSNSAVDVDGKSIVWDNGWKIVVTVADPTDATKTETIEIPFDEAGETEVDETKDFDWDGNGHIDQTVTVSGTVILEKAAQDVPVFDETSTNVNTGAFSGNGYTKAVTNGTGKGTLTYTMEENGYLQIEEATGKITVQAGKWSDFLTAVNNGDVTVEITATFAETDTHLVSSNAYTLTVGKNPDESLKFTAENVTKTFGKKGDGFDFTQTPVSGDKVNFRVTYESSDTAVASVDENGKVTFGKAGTATITATVTYDEKYTTSTSSYTLTIDKGPQEALSFAEKSVTVTYQYGGTYTNTLSGGSGTGAVSFKITEGDAATIDETTGKLTFVKAGQVTVTAYKEGDEQYLNAVPVSFVLKIEHADQSVTLQKQEDTVVNSTEAYDVAQYLQSVENCVSSEPYKFSIDEKSKTMAGVSVDSETGVLTIGALDYGTVTVKIERAGDECFKDMEAKYFTLTVNEMETDSSNFQISGDKINGENSEWYTSDVTIEYLDGHTVALHGEEFASEYKLTTQGVNNIMLCVLNGEHGGSAHNVSVPTIKIDKTAPESGIEYSGHLREKILDLMTFGMYKTTVQVTITAKDDHSGVYAIAYRLDSAEDFTVKEVGEDNKITFNVEPQYRGQIEYYAIDIAGHAEAAKKDGKTLVVDNIRPTLDVTYTYKETPDDLIGTAYRQHNGIIYTKYDVTAQLEITEANFDLADAPVVSVNDLRTQSNANQNLTWETEGDVNTANVDLKGEGDYILAIQFKDASDNPMGTYLQGVYIDKTAPVITLEEGLNDTCTNQDITTTITIEEHNFDADNTVIKVSGVDIEYNQVIPEYVYAVEWKHNGDIHEATITLTEDAIYTLTVNSTDLAGNVAEQANARFITEKTAPTNVTFSYSTPVLSKVIAGITFGYYNPEVVVTVIAEDQTSKVQKIDLTYTRKDDQADTHTSDENHVSDSNLQSKTLSKDADVNLDDIVYTNGGKTATATFTLKASELEQFFGSFSVVVTDRAGNATSVDSEAPIADTDDVIIVDNVAPEGSLEWNDAKQVLEEELTVGELVRPADTRYYDEKAVATFTVKEANFYGSEVVITDNGESITFDGDWVYSEGDVWTNTVTLTEEGDHLLEMTYTDRSNNKMESVVSKQIVIDHTDPVISLDKLNEGERHYYAQNQTVTVTIVEHNFRESDVKFLINAVNSSDVQQDPKVTYSEWTHEGDTHTITLTFTEDANYTVDVEYVDLSLRSIEDLPQQYLTVDHAAPENLTVTYSRSLGSQVLNAITFGYYDAPVTVTISAEDATSGIKEFVYSYILHENVSHVNAGGADISITGEDIKQDGNTFTAQFTIPESVLTANNQFNGYVDFTAIDYADLSTSTDNKDREDHTVIVDNINPTSTVAFNEPVQIHNDVAYYDGNINVEITINEANFVAADVNVAVTKDGVNYPVQVNWLSYNVNVHAGTFTLTEDGDYVVHVNYTDRSNNAMAAYTSQQLTIDTKAPEIGITNVVNDSANAGEVYSFDITASDTNFDITKFDPVLTALIRKEDGSFYEEKIDLGAMITVEEGSSYSYHIENLEKDAIYFLSCSVVDLANNASNQMHLEDGNAYSNVRFSINRNGSTFMLSEYTQSLVNDYYTRNVEADVQIIEINPDVLDEHKITLNGKELAEGTDYTVKAEGGNGKWMQYTYTVSSALFEAEGEYQLVVASKDKAGNHAFSDVKDATIEFVVDRTAPVISITGMATDGRYQTEIQTVTLIPTDDGGALKSLLVRTVDENGEPLQVLIDLSGEELDAALENGGGRLTFELGQGMYQNVEIICEDYAVSAEGANVYNEVFENLTVSTSSFMIFWANKKLRWGTIAGIGALAALIIFLIARKKKSI